MSEPDSLPRRRRWPAVLVALVVVVTLIVWWQRQPAAVNVLLITLDTTRADRIGCYGHSGAQTPAIDALAASGTLFEQAHTPVPLTLPAHTSLLTGLLPPEHGVRLNGAARLDSGIPTLTGALRDAGYRTGAFVAAIVLARKHGLDSGFETYDDDLSLAEPNPDQSHLYRDGRHVIDAALDWLEHGDSRPTFCWIHLYDPHDPYLDHADEFGDEFKGRAYDAEIAYVDRQISRLVEQLRTAGTLDHTLIVIAGDHGESLGEHGEQTHGYLIYKPATHVPLIMAGPGVPPGALVTEPVSLVDVFPTVSELLQLPPLAEISGRSLATAFNGQPLETVPAYAETMQPIHEANWAPLQSLSSDGWKYIRTKRPELYHLADDAAEARDLASAEPERVATLEAALKDLESGLRIREAAATALAPEERRALESLGYVAGTGAADLNAPSFDRLHDMKDMIGHLNDYRAAVELLHERHWEDAASILARVAAAAPDYFKAQTNLGTCYAQLQKFDDAAAAFERALALQPDLDATLDLAKVRILQGNGEAAVTLLEPVAQTEATNIGVQFFLGEAYRVAGQPAHAREAYEAALRIDPRFPPARAALESLPR